MDTHTARAIDGGLNAPLDKRQMGILCMAARSAYDVQEKMGLLDDGEEFDLWRHREQLRVIGVSSLRVARQRHYRPMLSHWLDLQGRPMQALASRQRGLLDADSQARAKLRQECIEAGEWFGSSADARQYAAGFLRHKRGVDVDCAHAKDLWHAIYIIRRRVCQLKRAAQREATARGRNVAAEVTERHEHTEHAAMSMAAAKKFFASISAPSVSSLPAVEVSHVS
jgi:hypothetical protein